MLLELASGLLLLPAVTATAREVRVGDLVAHARGGIDAETARRIVLRLPADRHRVTLRAEALLALVRRAAPALAVRATGEEVSIDMPRLRPRAGRCVAAAHAIAASAPIGAADVRETACGAARPARVRYDRGAAMPVAMRAIAGGTYLGHLAVPMARAIGAGAALTLRSVVGPVAVERPVTTLQPARAGGRVFVRDAGGAVLSARLALEAGR